MAANEENKVTIIAIAGWKGAADITVDAFQ
jgi:hypothetical protein